MCSDFSLNYGSTVLYVQDTLLRRRWQKQNTFVHSTAALCATTVELVTVCTVQPYVRMCLCVCVCTVCSKRATESKTIIPVFPPHLSFHNVTIYGAWYSTPLCEYWIQVFNTTGILDML